MSENEGEEARTKEGSQEEDEEKEVNINQNDKTEEPIIKDQRQICLDGH